MHTLAGQWKSSGETRRIKKKKIQKTPTVLRLRSGTTKGNYLRGNPLAKTVKLGGNHLHTEPVLQLTRKVKRIQKQHGTTTSKYRHTHPIFWKPSSPWSGTSMEDNQAILWNIRMWICLFGECSWIPLLEQRFISEKTRHEFKFCKDSSLENSGTALQGNRKAGQWSDWNHLHKHDQFPRFEVGIDKLIAQSSLSIFHCKSLHILRFCSLIGKDGRRSCWTLEEQNSMVFGQQLFQRTELNWWTTFGIRVGDFPRIHHSGRDIFISMFNDFVWDTEMMNYVKIIQRQFLKDMLKDSLAVIGLSLGLDLKRSGTELTTANQMDLGTELQRRCCWTSQDPVIRYSVVPVPWREEN